jgi:hypothetical protein
MGKTVITLSQILANMAPMMKDITPEVAEECWGSFSASTLAPASKVSIFIIHELPLL